MALAFDTLTTAQELQRDYEFSETQAQGIAKLVHHQLVGNVATKDDIAAVKEDIAAVKDDLAAVRTELKEDIAAVRTELKEDIARLEANMVTKDELRAEISGVEAKISGVRAEISGVKTDILKWIFGALIAQTALIIAILRFLGTASP